jgi:hypothetical protein
MYQVKLIPTEQCSYLWRYVKPLLEPAIKESSGRWQPEYVLVSLVNGYQQLWVVEEKNSKKIVAAATTQIIDYPEKRLFCMHFLGGKGWEDWCENLIDVCSKYAKQAGCDGVECNARPGFWKWFKNIGWSKSSVMYEKYF